VRQFIKQSEGHRPLWAFFIFIFFIPIAVKERTEKKTKVLDEDEKAKDGSKTEDIAST